MASKLIGDTPPRPQTSKEYNDRVQFILKKHDYDDYTKTFRKGLFARCPNDNCGVEFGIPDPKGFIRVEEIERLVRQLYDAETAIGYIRDELNELIYEHEEKSS